MDVSLEAWPEECGSEEGCWRSSGTTGRLCWEDMRDRVPSPLPITVICKARVVFHGAVQNCQQPLWIIFPFLFTAIGAVLMHKEKEKKKVC